MPDNHAPTAQDGQEVTEELKAYQISALNLLDIPFQLFRVVAGKMQAEGITIDIPTEPGELIERYLSGALDNPLIEASVNCSARAEQARAEVQRLKLEELSGSDDENIGYYIARNFCEGEALENLAMLGYRSIALKFIITQHIDSIMEASTEEDGIALLKVLKNKITPDLISDPSLTTELAEELTGENYWHIESAELLDAATEEGTLWAQAVAGAKRRREQPEEYPADALQMMIAGFADILDIAAVNQVHNEATPTAEAVSPSKEEKPQKKRTRKKKEQSAVDLAESIAALPMVKTPSTPGTLWLSKVINSAGGSGTLLDSKTNRHEKLDVRPDLETGALVFTRTTSETEHTIVMQNPKLFTETRSSTSNFDKMFTFALQNWAIQGYGDTIGFPLQSLVDFGIYSSVPAARRGVNDFINRTTTLIQGEKKLKGKDAGNSHYGVFIYSASIKSGFVYLRVNTDFRADIFSRYLALMPSWSYSLPNQSFSLLRYIMSIVRQEAGTTGSFTLSINAIQGQLGLPDKADVKNSKYREKIQDPIEKAIEDIEMACINPKNAATKGYNVKITPQYNPGCSIDEFLSSKITVEVESLLFAAIHEVKERQSAHIERASKRKPRALQEPKKPAK